MPTPSPSRPSARTHRFDQVPVPQLQRSVFDKNKTHKTTIDSGYLYPVYCAEVLPGDTHSIKASFFGRLQTLDFPILDNIYVDSFWFYCPNRLLWTNWARFLGAQDDPGDSIDFSIPIMLGEGGGAWTPTVGDMSDYFGLPIGEDLATQDISALPFRMYNRVWNEWFRAQEVQASVPMNVDDGPDDADNDYPLLRRGKRHDYLTSCLLSPQRGDAVSLPLGSTAPVYGNGTTLGLITDDPFNPATEVGGMYALAGNTTLRFAVDVYGDPVGTVPTEVQPAGLPHSVGVTTDPTKSGLTADLSAAVAATINEMREAIALQQILERDARMGTRYTERIFGQFGVVVPDFTAQRPEYLGGSSDRVNVLQVPQMTASPVTPTMSDAKGALAAYAQFQAQSGFTRSFVEHGYVMCLISCRADINYQQRIDRMWTRQTRFEFFDPLTAHLGEQAVLNKEVWYDTSGTPEAVFGYQERWADMRSSMNIISGKFRSDAAGTLDSWHLALDFPSQPALNAAFIEDDPPIERVVSVTTEPQILMDMFFKVREVRPMPVRSVPGLDRL